MPHDFPPWSTVSDYYRRWVKIGVWEQINRQLGKLVRLGEGFVVAPWRWVVERTFSWRSKSRRLCRDYEVWPENHEAVVYIVMIRLMLRRLTDNRRHRTSKTNHTA